MYHTLGILSSLYLCILNLTQGNVKFDMPPAIKNPENKNQLIHLIVESLFVFHVLSVCVSVVLFFSVCLCLYVFLFFCISVRFSVSMSILVCLSVCLSPSSLLSSKACHLVVDWAAKGKVFFPILRKTFDANNLPAHELGALSVLGNLWQSLEPGKVLKLIIIDSPEDENTFP